MNEQAAELDALAKRHEAITLDTTQSWCNEFHRDTANALRQYARDLRLREAATPIAFVLVGKGEAELVFARDVLHDKRGELAIARELGEGTHALYTQPSVAALNAEYTRGRADGWEARQSADAEVLAAVLAQLPVIRAKTGNALFDAGANDACDRIERAIRETKKGEKNGRL